jgi:hypothetical protein
LPLDQIAAGSDCYWVKIAAGSNGILAGPICEWKGLSRMIVPVSCWVRAMVFPQVWITDQNTQADFDARAGDPEHAHRRRSAGEHR